MAKILIAAGDYNVFDYIKNNQIKNPVFAEYISA